MTNTAIQEAIAQAQANAANVVPASAQTTAVAPAGAAPSMADFMNNTSAVDMWLKITEDGVKLGDDTKLHEELTFRVDFGAIDRFFQVVYGNPPVYERSRDRVTNLAGQPWTTVLQNAARVQPGVQDFMTANLTFEVIDDIEGKSSVVPAGTEIGYTLPFMGAKEFVRLCKKLAQEGHNIETGVFNVTVTGKGQANAKGQKYSKIVFVNAVPAD